MRICNFVIDMRRLFLLLLKLRKERTMRDAQIQL
jgi:hypothetical protein